MRTCTACAQPIPDDTSMFCPHCGAVAPLQTIAAFPPQPVAAAPVPPQPANYGNPVSRPGAMPCPFCGFQGPPVFSKKQLSTGGWVFFGVLLLTCFPLCWLPFVIDGCKEEEWRCPSCRVKRA